MTTEAKAQQADEDARHTGREQLQNWGAMLRSEPNCGPAGFKASPMFKDVVSRYADDAPRVRESYRADDAYLVVDLIKFLIPDEIERVVVYLFYAEESTHSNAAETLRRFNEMMSKERQPEISEAKLRAILNSAEIKIGVGLMMANCDDDWMEVAKLMRGGDGYI